MKYPTLTLITVISLLISFNVYSNVFIGSWQLVSGEYINEQNKLIDYADKEMSAIKVLSASHFSFISKSGEKFWAASAGSYQFDGKTYKEKPIHTSYALEKDSQYTFQYQMIGDFWHNSRWKGGKRVEYEIWRKLK